ncbi:MAG TPA: outer membrane protein assembly factor BamC [Burkholderiales bacterium]|nr:outer membrane protein assembly factor BamC [Burkholderiales bacterium]
MTRNLRRVAVILVAALALGGCESLPFFGKKDAYKSAQEVRPLEMPPDLTSPGKDERNVETSAQGSATFSDFSKSKTTQVAPGSANVLTTFDTLRIEREGGQRWLVVPAKPETVWPVVRQFWLDNGFVLKTEMPEVGIIETDWAEHRERVPEGGIRGLLNKVINTVRSTSQRDKFRTRLERGVESDTTEIYISHRGMVEVFDNEAKDHTVWQPKDDPEFEAEMLSRLMVRFGSQEAQAKTQIAESAPELVRATFTKRPDGSGALSLNDSFDRAWRRIGLALDRVGFTVEDRDRSQGLYFVRYADPEVTDKQKKGWLDKLVFWKSDEKKIPKNERYRIVVQEAGEQSRVNVLNKDGQPEKSETATRILTLLYEQLR